MIEQAEPLSQWAVDCVAIAKKQGHRITPCQSCGGPEIWSLINPESHCFRCNQHYKGNKARMLHRIQCDECRKFFTVMGLKLKYCDKCLVKREEKRKLATTPADGSERLRKGAETDVL